MDLEVFLQNIPLITLRPFLLVDCNRFCVIFVRFYRFYWNFSWWLSVDRFIWIFLVGELYFFRFIENSPYRSIYRFRKNIFFSWYLEK